ncbi:MAG: hypothetical protein EU517_01005, partial [Promethearchaeota archaeon]
LLKIYDIGPNIFKAATNEVHILLYEKKNGRPKDLEVYSNTGLKMLTYNDQKFDKLKMCKNSKCPLNDKLKKIHVYTLQSECPYCSFKTERLNRIRIKINASMLNLVNKIDQNGNLNYININDFPKLIRGEEDKGLKAVKRLLKNHTRESCVFINAKSDLTYYRYQKNKSFDIKKIPPEKMKGNDYEYYLKPKLLIKHNTTYPVSVYTEERVCFTSSIYSLLHDSKIELKFLCALLNSTLIKFYCIFGINNQVNTTINLNQYMIRHLPVIAANDDTKEKLATKVDSINSFYKQLKDKTHRIATLKEEIDTIIFQLYSISEEEKMLVFKNIQE